MLDFQQFTSIFVAALALALIPGPDTLLILGRSMTSGRTIGMATGAGTVLGLVVHTITAALGLSAILMTSSVAFSVVKFLGAAYLIYLGIQALRSPPLDLNHPEHKPVTASQALLQGMLSNVFNPKVALFFLSFLPQFVRPEHQQVTMQFLLLGLVVMGVVLMYNMGLALLSGTVREFMRKRPAVLRWQNRTMAGVFVALGIKLAFTSQN